MVTDPYRTLTVDIQPDLQHYDEIFKIYTHPQSLPVKPTSVERQAMRYTRQDLRDILGYGVNSPAGTEQERLEKRYTNIVVLPRRFGNLIVISLLASWDPSSEIRGLWLVTD